MTEDVKTWSDEKLSSSLKEFEEATRTVSEEIRRRREAKLPWRVGDIVRTTKHEVFRIGAVQAWSMGGGSYRGYRRLKNGAWGAALRYIYGEIVGMAE